MGFVRCPYGVRMVFVWHFAPLGADVVGLLHEALAKAVAPIGAKDAVRHRTEVARG